MRTHIVLVPGFGGFDALGQLSYYTGVTEQFMAWKSAHAATSQDRSRAVLHYFDNLPTAAVATRAKKLARFLAKLVERQIIQHDDTIVLAGHSTGGLDIRQLLRDLDVKDRELLRHVRRIAFLSVPQHGTNIADWVRAHERTARLLIGLLRRAVGLHVSVPLGPIELALRYLAPGHAQLFDAVADARRDVDPVDPDPLALADARKASAEIDLWLAQTDGDFFAIEDLACTPAGDRARVVDTPDVDAALWRRAEIETRSYATLGRCPFDPTDMEARSGEVRSLIEIGAAARAKVDATDFVYRVAYAACVGGPFSRLPVELPWLPSCGTGRRVVRRWENDGIVNTAAMVSPDNGQIFLVPGDHADVIGHFAERRREHPGGGRLRDGYDLLGSDDDFTGDMFVAVWQHLFDFAVPA